MMDATWINSMRKFQLMLRVSNNISTENEVLINIAEVKEFFNVYDSRLITQYDWYLIKLHEYLVYGNIENDQGRITNSKNLLGRLTNVEYQRNKE